MIPKIIHYCWFGGNPIPRKDQKCIDSWSKTCPDYKIIRWDESNYDIKKNDYMYEAYIGKKWGFVPDFARLDIIYNYGGIYLDTDVELIRNLDDLLCLDAFMGFEDGKHVSPGLCIAAKPKHPTIKKIMTDIYSKRHFRIDDNNFDLTPSPQMNTNLLLSLGLLQNNKKQTISGITIFPKDFFCPRDYENGKLHITSNTYSIHWFNASWHTPHQKRMMKIRRIIGKDLYFKLVNYKNRLIKKENDTVPHE